MINKETFERPKAKNNGKTSDQVKSKAEMHKKS